MADPQAPAVDDGDYCETRDLGPQRDGPVEQGHKAPTMGMTKNRGQERPTLKSSK